MVRTIFSGAWRIGRLTALALGLAVMLALVVGVASTAFGANGDPWLLGRGNVATAITKLAGAAGVNGPMLQLVNNNPDPNDTALDLQVQSGEAPMSVNSSTKVNNINADKLDGLDYSWFMRGRIYKTETITTEGQQLGDGTFRNVYWCDEGDFLISGGPANINKETDLLESFPAPPVVNGTNYSWAVRVDKNGLEDRFNVVVLCVDQWNP
ncbi:MAG: hypothetical protein M3151_02085 [Actinomycetota bacterium]|nr:hypothetical protein [Actinomycetota bacterium]